VVSRASSFAARQVGRGGALAGDLGFASPDPQAIENVIDQHGVQPLNGPITTTFPQAANGQPAAKSGLIFDGAGMLPVIEREQFLAFM
jgi:hypothetical protein